MSRRSLRVANSSGFFGDRFEAPRQMIDGGPIDVLTGDYLAELTMAILMRQRLEDPTKGYATTFLAQLEGILDDCVARHIKIITNAGGLNPAGLAAAVAALADDLNISVTVATVSGDDLAAGTAPDAPDLFDPRTGEKLASPFQHATANAYLGGWGIARALDEGADVVVTGRVTDAALAIGPAASHFGWARDDWDRLAGAMVAGHIIECGPQASGGNYSFFEEIDNPVEPGFPIAEIHEDGSSVITKHPGTAGSVSIGTVTAQLLYEISGPIYLNPDVSARLDTVQLAPEGTDRVRVTGVRGIGPPPTTKVAITGIDGYRNQVTFGLTGLAIEEKAALAEAALWLSLGGRGSVALAESRLIRTAAPDAESNEAATAYLQISVADPEQDAVGRRFSSAAVELALSNYPGLFLTAPPADARPRTRYRAAVVAQPVSVVTIDGKVYRVPPTSGAVQPPEATEVGVESTVHQHGPTVTAPLGTVIGARSGDKGGDANIGIWTRSDAAYEWIDTFLTVETLARLLPETSDYPVQRHRFPNLRGLNFVIEGLLGEGVADPVRWDPQAKGLGEYLRARLVEVPEVLVAR